MIEFNLLTHTHFVLAEQSLLNEICIYVLQTTGDFLPLDKFYFLHIFMLKASRHNLSILKGNLVQ
jgi:hypothetical protein